MEEPIRNAALEAAVAALFRQDASGHDFAHTQRVTALALRIARAEHADTRIVYLASLLHDADDPKLTGGKEGSTARAAVLLRQFGYDSETSAAVCAIIRKVSFKGSGADVPQSLAGQIVQDADRLDAIGAIGVARAFAYGGAKGRPMHTPELPPCAYASPEEYHSAGGSTVNHFYEKLLLLSARMNTETAKRLAQKRHRETETFLRLFLEEWNGEDGPAPTE